jgi:hypothetical protein
MAAAPYAFVGSDTLTEVVRDSITQCESTGGLCTPGSLTYTNTGSGAAETALLASPPTQRIAPMSRNFKQSVLTAHPNWNPQQQNIIGLDAAVIVEKNAASGFSKCPNLAAALDSAAPGKAQVDTLIGLVLAGKGGTGDTAACSHPDRLAAVDALAGCFGGISFIDHFYRRDDRSGTTDTMKERFRVQRFCNGRGPGLISGLDNNLANDDADPIRRTCVPASSTHAKTACTLWPASTQCTAGDANCTQGLVVALSQSDPNLPDITTSIARRIRLDSNNQTVGFAGREASRQTGNAATNINGISASNFAIRTSAYISSRRLYVNFSDIALADTANDTAQTNLYTWMTDPLQGGRGNVDPILVAHGFLPCTDDFSDPSGPNNLCSNQLPPPAAESTPGSCIPAGQPGNGGSNICCSTGTASPASSSNCPDYSCHPLNNACTGSGQGTCCAGLTCTDQGTGNFACN